MIFTDVVLPDGQKEYYLLDERVDVKKILAEPLLWESGSGQTAASMYNDHTGQRMDPDRTLAEQGICSGMRLRIESEL
ncbi:MAG: hypothetical protein J6Y57_05545 [Lachnospiraceae bacterium]|nr:hypothetical protein [Lachnospiraceae bacterium]